MNKLNSAVQFAFAHLRHTIVAVRVTPRACAWQDTLFPPNDRDTLPTFNTNAIEQWLWRFAEHDGAPATERMFVHMNDDYVFTKRIEPQVHSNTHPAR